MNLIQTKRRLSAAENPSRRKEGIENRHARLNKTIDGGYGKLKGKTFRISNMGDETDETIAAMLKAVDAALAETPKAAAA